VKGGAIRPDPPGLFHFEAWTNHNPHQEATHMSNREAQRQGYGLADLVAAEGFKTAHDLAEVYIMDSLVPAICTVCGYTTHYEPDSTRGWCEVCDKGSCVSALVLMGII